MNFISLLIPSFLTILILNFFFEIVPLEKIQGLPLVFPLFLCPIAAVFGFVSYRLKKDKLSQIGIIFNILLFIFPIAYNIIGTLLFGA
ncbi:hypothetical protein HOO54_03625 [Bacillus sp. WMMC1349]|nr:hypothetical protein [Bacillus sp. WMMC1349]